MKAHALVLLAFAAAAQAAPVAPSALPPEAEVRRVLASLPAHTMFYMLGAFIIGGGVFYFIGASLKANPQA